jgi:hypothetical protein
VSNINTTAEQGSESVELLDCGAASEVTKGAIFYLLTELGSAPFDKQLVL